MCLIKECIFGEMNLDSYVCLYTHKLFGEEILRMREYILIYVTATIPQDTSERHLRSLSALKFASLSSRCVFKY